MDVNQAFQLLQNIAHQLDTLNRTLIHMQAQFPGRSPEDVQRELNAHMQGPGTAAPQTQTAAPTGAQVPPQTAPSTAGQPVVSVDDLKAVFQQMVDKFGPDARRMLKAEWNLGGPTMAKKDQRAGVLQWMQEKLGDGGAAAAGAPQVPQQTAPTPGMPPPGTVPPPAAGTAPGVQQGLTAPQGVPQQGMQPGMQVPQVQVPQMQPQSNLDLLRAKAKGYFDGPQTAHFMSLMLEGNGMTAEQVVTQMDEANLQHFLSLAENAMIEQKVLSG